MKPMAPGSDRTHPVRRLRLLVLGMASLIPALIAASCNVSETMMPLPLGAGGASSSSSASKSSSSNSSSSSSSTGAGGGATSSSSGAGGGDAGPSTVKVQILAINDFHGNLAPP